MKKIEKDGRTRELFSQPGASVDQFLLISNDSEGGDQWVRLNVEV